MSLVRVIMLVLMSGCGKSGHSSSNIAATASEESAVQTAVLDSFFVRPGIERIVVLDSTVRGADHFVDEDYARALKALGELPPGLREDFELKRERQMHVRGLHTRVPAVMLGAREL